MVILFFKCVEAALEEARAQQTCKMQITIASVFMLGYIRCVVFDSVQVVQDANIALKQTGLGGVTGCCGVGVALLHTDSNCRQTFVATAILLRILLSCHGLILLPRPMSTGTH